MKKNETLKNWKTKIISLIKENCQLNIEWFLMILQSTFELQT